MWLNIRNIKFALFVCILHTSIIIDGSAQTKVHGSVLDINGLPLADATVLLLSFKDSSLVKGLMTAKGGKYVFEKYYPVSI